ncbi:MAG: low molecular weight protein arginine phosphatase [Actinomycetota bacterium]|nr:low molecular weight protein arginine phosphatase [Actinomycetota bacterium]
MIKIVFVCTGNICRSPVAEALFRARMSRDYPRLAHLVEVSSCGTSAIEGNIATSAAVQSMDLWSIDLAGHRSMPCTGRLIEEADLVLVMAREHLLYLERMRPRSKHKTTTLKDLAGIAGEVSRRMGEETAAGEGEARGRLEGILHTLGERPHEEGFMADMYSRGSDIIDPIGSSLQTYIGVAEDIDSSLGAALRALFGRPDR